MNLKYVKMFRYGSKEFKLFEDENFNRYILKLTDLRNYTLLSQIASIANESPNLLEIKGFSKTPNNELSYIIPLVQGKTLEEYYILNRPLKTEVIDDILYQVCQGLLALHSKNILHRDIKPANIMIRDTGEVVLIDYDISRVYDSVKKDDTIHSGTKGYAAPEQFGFMQTSYSTDIFSLGITISELISDLDEADRLKYDLLVSKATKIDPSERFQSIQEVIDIISNENTTLFDAQVAQIKDGISLGLSSVQTSIYAKSELNAKQMGVIKHALLEGVTIEIINLLLDPIFTSKQMWQIKRGYLDGLDISIIKDYAKPYFSSDEMSIYRSGLCENYSKIKIFSNIKNYEIIKNTYQLDSENLIILRMGFYNGLDLKHILEIILSDLDYDLKKIKIRG